jgi:glycerol-3-phosphate cytidylyltransferase
MTIGFTCGTFDLFHVGHILMLKEAKSVCDYLIVGIQTNPQLDRKNKRKPIQSLFERIAQIKACKYVDRIVVYETEHDLEDLLNFMDIDIRIVGEDHEGKSITGQEICKKRNIPIYYNSRKHNFSTTELIERIKNGKT